ncbi:hypothetical protein WEH80_07760 [Actinomycetes bacterium KLBMP 9759]
MPATAAVFETGAMSVRHVDAIRRVLASHEASRLEPSVCTDIETSLRTRHRCSNPKI